MHVHFRASTETALSLNEAAKAAGISRKTLSRRIKDGSGPAIIRIGRRVVIRQSSFDQWLQSLEVAGGGTPAG